MSAISSWVGGKLHRLLGDFCDVYRLGWVFPADIAYQCFQGSDGIVRRPDVSFIRLGRLPNENLPDGYIVIPPDLAAEVVSMNDLAYELDRKVSRYLKAGVHLVWVINPDLRIMRVHRADGSVTALYEPDVLTGEEVVPGFRCSVRDLFPPRAAREECRASRAKSEAGVSLGGGGGSNPRLRNREPRVPISTDPG
jgi:Uma2 family endonuclease